MTAWVFFFPLTAAVEIVEVPARVAITAYAVALSTSSHVTVRLAFKYGASVLVLTTTFVGTPRAAE